MFHVYAVRLIGGQKHRFFVSEAETIEAARHIANCATCGNADYAYVKETGGYTVFFLRHPGYREVPIDPANPPRKIAPYPGP